MSYSPLIDQLIESFQCLPGVGPKSAQRMTFHLLERNREAGLALSVSMTQAMKKVAHCQRCRNFSEVDCCNICSDDARDQHTLCVVEGPSDVAAIEQSGAYRGLYFVLMGHLSPLDGMGPAELGMDLLSTILYKAPLHELILATSATFEGEATAHYITEMAAKAPIKISRIAYGVPLGGELEFVDGGTLARAIAGRNQLS